MSHHSLITGNIPQILCVYWKWRIIGKGCLIVRVTKYFPVKNISHRLSPGVIHIQKVLRPALVIHLPFNSPKVPALCSWWIQTFFSISVAAIKNIRPQPQFGWGERKICSLLHILLHPHALFWAALWANVLSKMVLLKCLSLLHFVFSNIPAHCWVFLWERDAILWLDFHLPNLSLLFWETSSTVLTAWECKISKPAFFYFIMSSSPTLRPTDFYSKN